MASRNDLGAVSVMLKAREGRIALDELIGALQHQFAGCRVATHDWYGDRRREALRIIAEREKAGKPLAHPDVILEDLDRAEKALGGGARKILVFPLPDGKELKCDISDVHLALTGAFPLRGHKFAKAILDFLESVGVVDRIQWMS